MLWPTDGSWPGPTPASPLPTEPRPPCWPAGFCTPYAKLPCRVAGIALASGGSPNAAFAHWAGGQLLVANASNPPSSGMSYTGESFFPGLSIDSVIIELISPGLWRMTATSSLAITHPVDFLATATFAGTIDCPFEVSLPVYTCTGPAPQPDEIRVKALRWFEASPYPYYGP